MMQKNPPSAGDAPPPPPPQQTLPLQARVGWGLGASVGGGTVHGLMSLTPAAARTCARAAFIREPTRRNTQETEYWILESASNKTNTAHQTDGLRRWNASCRPRERRCGEKHGSWVAILSRAVPSSALSDFPSLPGKAAKPPPRVSRSEAFWCSWVGALS